MPPPDENTDSTAINPHLAGGRQYARREPPAVEALAEGICGGERTALSRAITLVESTRPEHRRRALDLLEVCRAPSPAGASPKEEPTLRLAVTGVPGAGKSTFIEALGTQLLERDEERRLAVLTIDPSSTRSGGSILGDKTRMGTLAGHDRAFVRPSPTAGTLGGVARRTRESILLCEAAGYDCIFVETVGVGQAEVEVHAMTDVFLLLALAGAGDQLQGIKRGVVEMADLIAINKADGDRRAAAEAARADYEKALQLYPVPAIGERPRVLTCSAQTGTGLEEVWTSIQHFVEQSHKQGLFEQKRRRQTRRWFRRALEDRLHETFFADENVQEALPGLETDVEAGRLSVYTAAEQLLEMWHEP